MNALLTRKKKTTTADLTLILFLLYCFSPTADLPKFPGALNV